LWTKHIRLFFVFPHLPRYPADLQRANFMQRVSALISVLQSLQVRTCTLTFCLAAFISRLCTCTFSLGP
jgi:hypothetical protein